MNPSSEFESAKELSAALREIDRLKRELAEAAELRDSYWQTIRDILPPIPEEYDFQESDLEKMLAEATPVDSFLEELFEDLAKLPGEEAIS
jgi:hypothetical protein